MRTSIDSTREYYLEFGGDGMGEQCARVFDLNGRSLCTVYPRTSERSDKFVARAKDICGRLEQTHPKRRAVG